MSIRWQRQLLLSKCYHKNPGSDGCGNQIAGLMEGASTSRVNLTNNNDYGLVSELLTASAFPLRRSNAWRVIVMLWRDVGTSKLDLNRTLAALRIAANRHAATVVNRRCWREAGRPIPSKLPPSVFGTLMSFSSTSRARRYDLRLFAFHAMLAAREFRLNQTSQGGHV